MYFPVELRCSRNAILLFACAKCSSNVAMVRVILLLFYLDYNRLKVSWNWYTIDVFDNYGFN